MPADEDTADIACQGPGRGRLSRRPGPRVSESGWLSWGGGSVPAVQATATVAQTHSLMPLLDERRLRRAARSCMRRRSCPGVDGLTWAGYRDGFPARISDLARRVRDGRWEPAPLRTVCVPSYVGKPLQVVVPTVEDRIVHRAMRAAIEPILEACAFPPWASGWRRGHNRIDAVRSAATHVARGLEWIVDVDVATVSVGMTVEEILDLLADYVSDGTFLDRVRTALGGLPDPLAAGSGLTPLLLCLRLSQVDRALADLPVVRFGDDYTVFAASEHDALAGRDRITAALAACRLQPNPIKSRISPPRTANPEDLFLLIG